MATAIIDEQYRTEAKRLETEVTAQHEAIRAEAAKARAELVQFRPRAIEIRPDAEPHISVASQRALAREQIDQWERQQLQALTRVHLEAQRDLQAQRRHLEVEAREARHFEAEFRKQHVEIAPDQWIDKPLWQALTPEQQQEVRELGHYTVPDQKYFKIDAEGRQTEIPLNEYLQLTMQEQKLAAMSDAEVWEELKRDPAQGIPDNAIFSHLDKAPDDSVVAHYEIPGAEGEVTYYTYDDRGNEVPISEAEYTRLQAEAAELEHTHVKVNLPDGVVGYVKPDIWHSLSPEEQDEVRRTGFVTTQHIEVETAAGKQTFSASDWEEKSDAKKLEAILGRPPMLSEYQFYKLTESNIDSATVRVALMLPWITQPSGMIISAIPGLREREKTAQIWRVTQDAQTEWQREYPEEMWWGAFANSLFMLGMPAYEKLIYRAAREESEREALAPTRQDWIFTGISTALITLPIWLPPAVRAVKVVGAKIPKVGKFTARLGTHPFSEAPGIKKVSLPVKKPLPKVKVIGPDEIGMSSAEFQRFIRARASMPGLTPDTFRTLEAAKGIGRVGKLLPSEAAYLRELAAAKTVAQRLAVQKAAEEAARIAKWPAAKQKWIEEMAKVVAQQPGKTISVPVKTPARIPTWRAPTLPQVTGAPGWARPVGTWVGRVPAPRVAAPTPAVTAPTPTPVGWVTTPAGRLMPIGATPIMLPDVPIIMNIAAPGLKPRYVTKIVTAGQAAVLSAVPALERAAVLEQLRAAEAQYARIATPSVTKARLAAAHYDALRAGVIAAQRALEQGLSVAKAQALAQAAVKQSLATTTKLENLTAAQTKTIEATATQMAIAQATAMQVATHAATQALLQGKTITQAKTEALQAVRTSTAVQTATKTLTSTQTAAITKTATNTAISTAIATKTVTETVTKKPTKVTKKIPKKFWPKLKKKREKEEEERDFPPGTITWRQGFVWKVIPPPYDVKKAISMKYPPKGADTSGRTPEETIQVIGGPVPRAVHKDLGFVDIYIDANEEEIHFKGGGLETNIGKRIPKPTKGILLVEEIEEAPEEPMIKTGRRSLSHMGTRHKQREASPGVRTYLGRGLEYPYYMKRL